MTFRCLECGHIFEDGEQAVWEERHGLDSPPYEQFSGCPICRGGYEEAMPCKCCGGEYTDMELYRGWCKECLQNQITYSTFFDYCEAHKDEHYIETFVMGDLLGGMDCPDGISYEFHQLMVDTYKRRVAEAKMLTHMDFLKDCVRFIMIDDDGIERDKFANWLNKREVKNND